VGVDLLVASFTFGLTPCDTERVGLVVGARTRSALLGQDRDAHGARDRPLTIHAAEERLLTSVELRHVRDCRGGAPPIPERTANGRRAEGALFVNLRGGATTFENRRERAQADLNEAVMRPWRGPCPGRVDGYAPHSSSPGSTFKMVFAK